MSTQNRSNNTAILNPDQYTNCNNTETILGDIIWEDVDGNRVVRYPTGSDILSYVDKSNRRYCFGPGDLEGLLRYPNNPWTREKLPDEFLELLRNYIELNPIMEDDTPDIPELAMIRTQVDLDLQKGPYGDGRPDDPYISFTDLISKRGIDKWNLLPENLKELTDDELLRNFYNNRQMLIRTIKRNYALVKIVSTDDDDQRAEFRHILRVLYYRIVLNFFGQDLSGRDFSEKNLQGANFVGTTLRGTNFTGADLTGAIFRNNLRDTIFRGATLRNTDLRDTDLRGTDFKGAFMQEARLDYSDLRGANLKDADLQRANFTGADLTGENFTGVNLKFVNFTDANLTGVNFTDANLTHAIFDNATLDDTNFTRAILRDENITENFSQIQISQMNSIKSFMLNDDSRRILSSRVLEFAINAQ